MSELDVTGLPVFPKLQFSMFIPEVKEHLKQYPGTVDLPTTLVAIHSIFRLGKIIFQLQDSCLADCNFLQNKTQFCRTGLKVIIVILEMFTGNLSDQN